MINKQEILKLIEEIQGNISEYKSYKYSTVFMDLNEEESKDPIKKAPTMLYNLNKSLNSLKALLVIQELKPLLPPKNQVIKKPLFGEIGLVKVRPCAKEYDDKTYLGFLIGEIATGTSLLLTSENEIILELTQHNPAIYVPELNKIIYGIESWWGNINSEDELKNITNDDIENVWYIKLLKNLNTKKDNQDNEKEI